MARYISWENRRYRKKFRKQYAFYYARNNLSGFPVTGYEGQKERLRQVFDGMQGSKYMAETSGTTREPKLIPYDEARTRHLQKTFLKSMMTLTCVYPGRKTFFVFASLNKDQSLTSGMMVEKQNPSLIELLQAPYRYLYTEEGQALVERVGDLSARIMVLIITQPRFLYATNPSTLTYFLKELELRWKEIRVRIKNIPPGLLRLSDGDGERRIMSLVIREKPPGIKEIIPNLTAVITWDGGYVKPFHDQLSTYFQGIDLLPMYSMSTETIETLPHRIRGKLYFFPLSKGFYPEFREPESEKILTLFELEKGKSYELIVSDEWGMRRYATSDMFKVVNLIDDLPDLVFVKRVSLTSSLTGEKITEEQALDLIQKLKNRFPELSSLSLSLYPASHEGNVGYHLALIGNFFLPLSLARVAEDELGKINSEYQSKVKSGRLKPLEVVMLTEQEFAIKMGKENHWESQFKVLPLYARLINI